MNGRHFAGAQRPPQAAALVRSSQVDGVVNVAQRIAVAKADLGVRGDVGLAEFLLSFPILGFVPGGICGSTSEGTPHPKCASPPCRTIRQASAASSISRSLVGVNQCRDRQGRALRPVNIIPLRGCLDEFAGPRSASGVGRQELRSGAAEKLFDGFSTKRRRPVAQLGGAPPAVVSNVLTKQLEWGRLMAPRQSTLRALPTGCTADGGITSRIGRRPRSLHAGDGRGVQAMRNGSRGISSRHQGLRTGRRSPVPTCRGPRYCALCQPRPVNLGITAQAGVRALLLRLRAITGGGDSPTRC